MIEIKRFLFSLAALMVICSVAMAAPAAARGGTGGDTGSISSDDGSSRVTGIDDSRLPPAPVNDNETETENHAHDLAELFRQQGREKIAAEKKAKGHSIQQRQQACEARKANLTRRMSRASVQAAKHQEVFDKIYGRLKQFYIDKNLNVAGYDGMVAKVNQAQSDSQAKVEALKTLDVSIDCTSATVAENVSAFRQAVGSTRDSLKAYRATLVDLINSLKGASTAVENPNARRLPPQ